MPQFSGMKWGTDERRRSALTMLFLIKSLQTVKTVGSRGHLVPQSSTLTKYYSDVFKNVFKKRRLQPSL